MCTVASCRTSRWTVTSACGRITRSARIRRASRGTRHRLARTTRALWTGVFAGNVSADDSPLFQAYSHRLLLLGGASALIHKLITSDRRLWIVAGQPAESPV